MRDRDPSNRLTRWELNAQLQTIAIDLHDLWRQVTDLDDARYAIVDRASRPALARVRQTIAALRQTLSHHVAGDSTSGET